MDLKKTARKHALKNAFDYGRADAKAVVGKVLAESPEAKKEIKKTMALVQKIVDEINALTKKEVERELARFEFKKKVEPAEKRFALEDAVEGKVITRFLPEPNGFLHIGHAKAVWLSVEAARQWSGRCLLRFDDTNPETERGEFVDAIREDLAWLGLKFARESFASDFMPKFYECATQLVEQGDAYVCVCERKKINENRKKRIECDCRTRSAGENRALWNRLVAGGFGEEKAILRLKGDMHSLNTVMRDPTLFRIVSAPHYRQGRKYFAWPTYDFEVSIADSLEGITHALRSKEYELRDELYYAILDKLGLRKPRVYDFSRLNIRGTVLSKRLLKPLVEQKKVWGWDDPRLPTIRGLTRRGVLPEAIRSFILSFGLSKVESTPSWEALLVENRRLLDPIAEHYFFVADQMKLFVENASGEVVRIPKHPEKGGERVIKTSSEFFIASDDARTLREGEVFRLKDLYNVRLTEKKRSELKGEFAGKELREGKKIQWVAAQEAIPAELIVLSDLFVGGEFNEESLQTKKGFCEKACRDLREGQVIQFERVGFARVDDTRKMRFILSC